MSERDGRVIGIDPGSRTTGWGVVERVGGRMVVVASGVAGKFGTRWVASLLRLVAFRPRC